MAFAITQNCCKDASCVSVCPVNCIHPAPDEPGFGTGEMLYVDPQSCIDCGACADACPVDAIVPAESLWGPEMVYADLNAEHYRSGRAASQGAQGALSVDRPTFRTWSEPSFAWAESSGFAGRVAVIGTGPSGMYAMDHLLLRSSAEVVLLDRLPVTGGLVRFGVAPDHPSTKRVSDTFARLMRHPRVGTHVGLELGRDLTLEELRERVDAVVVAVGAADGRRLGIPGEDLPGSLTAPQVVSWYNAHPDVPAGAVDLDVPSARAVVVGTGNVALDVARVLTSDPDRLVGTTIAPHALAAIRGGTVREVVVLGRRGPAHAAYTVPEVLALAQSADVELVVDGDLPDGGLPEGHPLRGVPHRRVDLSLPPAPGRRIVLRFDSQVDRVEGDGRVERVVLADETVVPAGLLVTSIGYRGHRIPGLPYDEERGTVPHVAGRVQGEQEMTGVYVVGWAKRGPSGGIGDNRVDAAETVDALLADAAAGRLPAARGSTRSLARWLRGRSRAARLEGRDRQTEQTDARPATLSGVI